MSKRKDIILDRFYRYLGCIKTSGHALLFSAILASASSLFSLVGTNFAFQDVDSPSFALVSVLAYMLPFGLVLLSSFVLIRGYAILDMRNKELSMAADRDGLTHLINRAAFYRKGSEMAIQADLQHSPLSLIMVDADHFKSINDTHGHLAGDSALQHLADIMRQCSRESDLIARWGGEEFGILLRSASTSGAQAFAERLRQTVANCPLYWDGAEISLTLSAGVAQWNHAGDDFEAMVLRADKALYEAKACGRNQVQVAQFFIEQVEGFRQDVEFRDAVA